MNLEGINRTLSRCIDQIQGEKDPTSLKRMIREQV